MLHTAAHNARKALSVPRYYGGGLFKVLSTDPVFLWAQAIAFKTFVTMLPLLLLAVGIFGQVLRQEDPFTTVSGFLRAFLPPSQSDGLVQLLLSLQEASGTITFFGAAAFLFTVITLFATLRYVIGAAMGESRHQMRPIVGGYLFDLRMMAQVGSLFLLSFITTAAARVLSARSGAVASQMGLDAGAVDAATGGLVQVVTLLVPYVLTVGMLAQLYYFVPRPRPPLKSALWGAAAGALLFELAKNGFALYATHVANFDQYADEAEGLGGLGGVFGLILAFVFWVYFSGLILIVGAAVTMLYEKRHRPRLSRLRARWARQKDALLRHRRRFAAEQEAYERATNGASADAASGAPAGAAGRGGLAADPPPVSRPPPEPSGDGTAAPDPVPSSP